MTAAVLDGLASFRVYHCTFLQRLKTGYFTFKHEPKPGMFRIRVSLKVSRLTAYNLSLCVHRAVKGCTEVKNSI